MNKKKITMIVIACAMQVGSFIGLQASMVGAEPTVAPKAPKPYLTLTTCKQLMREIGHLQIAWTDRPFFPQGVQMQNDAVKKQGYLDDPQFKALYMQATKDPNSPALHHRIKAACGASNFNASRADRSVGGSWNA